FYMDVDYYNVVMISYYTTDDIVVDFELSGEAIEALVALSEQTAEATEEEADPAALNPAGTITLKDFTVAYTFDEMELKDGLSVPSNALMLLIASLIG